MKVHVTKTGRSLGSGKVTKKSRLVRTRSRGQERPLPFALQCHPKALTPTPMHPYCKTRDPSSRWAVHYIHKATDEGYTTGFGEGRWLSGQGPYRVVVPGFGEWRHNDLYQALGWTWAAIKFGYQAEVHNG